MNDEPKPPRPTLGELAAESAADRGLACPDCGCRDLRASHTYRTGPANSIRRRRVCRRCGRVVHTYERLPR